MEIKDVTKDLVENTKDILGDKLHKIILYGSYSRNDYNEDSDVDIMVLADLEESELHQYRKGINRVASRIGLKNDIILSVALKDKDDFYDKIDILPFYQNILREGIEIDDQ